MTSEREESIRIASRARTWEGIVLIVIIIGLVVIMWPRRAEGQSGPALRLNATCFDSTGTPADCLLAYTGPLPSGARIAVWTTNSLSPNATAGSPWDQVGEQLYSYDAAAIAWVVNGTIVPGWVIVPIRRSRILMPSTGEWIDDVWRRIIVMVSDTPGCATVSCGARVVVSRTAWVDVPMAPINTRRRAVAP